MEPALCQGNPTYRGERAAGKAGWNLLRFWEAGCAELFQQQWWARGEESSAGAALCLQVQLEDRNQDMHQLGDPQEEMGKLPGSKTDFPARMALSEEEKLKISKDLVDLQIETNKMKERYETENFRLKNTMQALERRVQELELCSASVTWERDSLRERLRALESSRQELGEEFIILKSNYLALGRELDQEVMRNEELTQELLSLAKESIHPPGSAHQSSPKLGRGRAAGHPHSARRGKPEDAAASEHEQQELERNLLGNQDHIKVELEKLKKTQDEKQQRLEEQMLVLGKELQEVRGAELCCTVGDRRHRLVEQSAVLLTSQGQLQEVEAENSRLQLQLKELNEEYRSRLARYIRDVANYMDSKPSSVTGHSKAPAGQAAMKNFVESMLKDIRASYKSREEQLARAARGYKKRMKDLAKKHENLLIAYGLQREQIRSLGSSAVDCGPAELHFSITDPELLTNSSRELNRLREEKAKLEMQLQELQKKNQKGASAFPVPPEQQLDEEGWAEVRKKLREFTLNSQEELEQERSQLLTRAVVAEEQVVELQGYIDQHLARAKLTLHRSELERMAEQSLSPGAAASPTPGPSSSSKTKQKPQRNNQAKLYFYKLNRNKIAIIQKEALELYLLNPVLTP
ncbi:coiled-coil domain-containing protein 78 isoform X3 [Parus major]|uniref:coiled-coil domain-containing protein 78 isoform X3 n=1 Tax=Parus major TaxID=9157 RepID=UPI0007711A1F|nr:coiled-coil domain-containing protein 78 isoform X3 [Parus major]